MAPNRYTNTEQRDRDVPTTTAHCPHTRPRQCTVPPHSLLPHTPNSPRRHRHRHRRRRRRTRRPRRQRHTGTQTQPRDAQTPQPGPAAGTRDGTTSGTADTDRCHRGQLFIARVLRRSPWKDREILRPFADCSVGPVIQSPMQFDVKQQVVFLLPSLAAYVCVCDGVMVCDGV